MSATVLIYFFWAATTGLTTLTILRALHVTHPLSSTKQSAFVTRQGAAQLR